MASSSLAPEDPPLDPQDAQRLLRSQLAGKPRRIGPHSAWLGLSLFAADRRARRGALLLIESLHAESTEIERMVVTQTAGAIELVLGQARLGGPLAGESANREALVADLLLGRLVSREAADARARLLSLEPTRAIRVALFASTRADLAQRIRAVFPLDRRFAAAGPSETEFATIVPADGSFEASWRDLLTLANAARTRDDALLLVVSNNVPGPAFAGRALAQTRVLAGLCRAGAIDGWLVDAGDQERVGIYGLLYALWSQPDGDRSAEAQRLKGFADLFLAALEAADDRRGGELVATLAAYLRGGGALAETAEALGVHRNTLAYRLGRINQITGRDLADTRTRFLLQVALAIRDLERAAARL
jgi:purine catabolism regulator